MKKHTIQITITPKKGEFVTLRFAVFQRIFYPDIHNEGCNLAWRNTEGLFSRYGKPAQGLSKDYCFQLLAEGVDTLPTDYNRTHLAGYDGNKGSFALRGAEIGETEITLQANGFEKVRVRGFDTPTPGESNFFKEQILPTLRAYCTENSGSLHAEAVETLTLIMHKRIAEAHAQIDKLEKQIATATF